jgi:hypothetical protein
MYKKNMLKKYKNEKKSRVLARRRGRLERPRAELVLR